MAEIIFPVSGLHVGFPASKQPQGTSRHLNNVRPIYDGRACGGQRPGLKKWGEGTLVGASEQPIVAICSVSSVI